MELTRDASDESGAQVFEEGEELILEGKLNTKIFLIESGFVEVLKNSSSGGYRENGSVNWLYYVPGAGAYVLFCPAQELCSRCAIQAPLYEFVDDSPLRRHLTAILISNLLTAGVHIHLGLGMAFMAFLPGLFWGWLFVRHRSIVGVSISHAMIGAYSIFALNIEGLISATP